MRRSVLSALMVLTVLGAWSVSAAQDSAKKADSGSAEALKPIVVVSFAGLNQAMQAVKTIDKLGDGVLTAAVEAGIERLAGARDVPGLDAKRPWGLVVQTDGQQFPVVAFIPVTDAKKLLAALEPTIGKAQEASKDVLELQVRNQPLFIAQRDGWACIAPTPEFLQSAPKDPAKLLGSLNESYDLAVRVTVSNVPPVYRQMFLGLMQMGMQQGMERQSGESDEQYALRIKLVKQSMQQMSTVINELDTFLLGVKVNEKSSSAEIDVQVVALPGTKTAKQLATDGDMKSRFAGFFTSDAAFALHFVSKLAETDIAQAKTTLTAARGNALKELDKQELSEADKKLAKQMVGDLFDIAQKTLETGRVDGGITVFAKPKVLTLVAGAAMADTAKLESVVKQLVPHIAKEAPEIADKIKLNAGDCDGVTLHTLAIPTDALDEAGPILAGMVGESLDVVIGIGPDSVYLAAGRNAVSSLRETIAKCKSSEGKSTPPMQWSVDITTIAKTVAAHGRREVAKQVATKVAEALESLPGKDHIRATQLVIPNGQRYQIVLESGILKLIAVSPTLAPGE